MREALGADGMAVAVLPEARDGEKRLGLVAYGGQAGSTVGVPIFCVADEFYSRPTKLPNFEPTAFAAAVTAKPHVALIFPRVADSSAAGAGRSFHISVPPKCGV